MTSLHDRYVYAFGTRAPSTTRATVCRSLDGTLAVGLRGSWPEWCLSVENTPISKVRKGVIRREPAAQDIRRTLFDRRPQDRVEREGRRGVARASERAALLPAPFRRRQRQRRRQKQQRGAALLGWPAQQLLERASSRQPSRCYRTVSRASPR